MIKVIVIIWTLILSTVRFLLSPVGLIMACFDRLKTIIGGLTILIFLCALIYGVYNAGYNTGKKEKNSIIYYK